MQHQPYRSLGDNQLKCLTCGRPTHPITVAKSAGAAGRGGDHTSITWVRESFGLALVILMSMALFIGLPWWGALAGLVVGTAVLYGVTLMLTDDVRARAGGVPCGTCDRPARQRVVS